MTPNGGNQATTISFMSLKSSPATNQEPTQGRGTGLQPGPMTTMLEQDNQVAKLGVMTNERTPRPSAILLPLDPSPRFPQPCLSQCPNEPQQKMLSLEVGCYIDPRTLRSKLIAHTAITLSSRSPGPLAPLPTVFCLPGASFGPVCFTEYPLKPKYKDYTPEKIIKLDPLARIQSATRYNRQGLWIFSTPKLFRGKFNYLPAYNVYMELPVTPKPMLASSPNLPTNHTSKLFGIVYINFTGVVDTIVPAAGLWSWLGKSASYLLKLAPLLWWALPAKNLAQVTSKTGRLAAREWVPDMWEYCNMKVESLSVRAQNGPDKTLCCIGSTPAMKQFPNQTITLSITQINPKETLILSEELNPGQCQAWGQLKTLPKLSGKDFNWLTPSEPQNWRLELPNGPKSPCQLSQEKIMKGSI
ncbi:hypothetical protein DSO57_1002085 [Entomophthora muscae]|uniref:Uncharacterized protein n=1 Tax=Entomophthora muscae TaxID=34485 RepID=A0ACC2RZS8_9FUNG|nr:hypothetical protein DSO57_1002085 [Entomophthora muscae]